MILVDIGVASLEAKFDNPSLSDWAKMLGKIVIPCWYYSQRRCIPSASSFTVTKFGLEPLQPDTYSYSSTSDQHFPFLMFSRIRMRDCDYNRLSAATTDNSYEYKLAK